MNNQFHVDFTSLAPTDVLAKCEREFQTQLNQTDGELFIWSKGVFCGINLNDPSSIAQAVLQYFADSGCPISGMLLGRTLYPFALNQWPIRSTEISFNYIFNAI